MSDGGYRSSDCDTVRLAGGSSAHFPKSASQAKTASRGPRSLALSERALPAGVASYCPDGDMRTTGQKECDMPIPRMQSALNYFNFSSRSLSRMACHDVSR